MDEKYQELFKMVRSRIRESTQVATVLNLKTPAQAAKADSPYKSWRDVVEKE